MDPSGARAHDFRRQVRQGPQPAVQPGAGAEAASADLVRRRFRRHAVDGEGSGRWLGDAQERQQEAPRRDSRRARLAQTADDGDEEPARLRRRHARRRHRRGEESLRSDAGSLAGIRHGGGRAVVQQVQQVAHAAAAVAQAAGGVDHGVHTGQPGRPGGGLIPAGQGAQGAVDGLMAGADRDLEKVWEKFNAGRFENIMLKTRAAKAEVKPDGIQVTFEGENAPAQAQTYDLVLVAVGRTPNGKKIAADQAGVQVDERGFIPVDQQMRTNVANIFAIGDLVGQPMLAHKAVHEGHVAAEAAAGEKSYFDAKQIPSVAYTDPEVAWAGLTEEQCKAKGIAYEKGLFPWAASGRAIANGRDEGFTKLIFDANTHRIIGGGIVGTHAGDLIGEVCLAIEMGADAVDIGKTIHPHPTLGESVGLAAEAAHGHCTDLPPVKKKSV